MKKIPSPKAVFLLLLQLSILPLLSQPFLELTQVFQGTSSGCGQFGDYDDDGDLDIAITGSAYTIIYRNDGSDTFFNISAGLKPLGYSSLAWGDYDNDGDLDIVLTGFSSPDMFCFIYRNDGNDIFTEIDPGIEGVRYGSVEWGDYNLDGKLDILICGESASGRITKIYENKGSDLFKDAGANLPGVQDGNATWGDYDNDGDLDVLLTGKDVSHKRLSALYTNLGNNIFQVFNTTIINAYNSSASWADFDDDGDLDIALAGYTTNGYGIVFYRNDASILFTKIENDLTALNYTSTDWGDFDNDGDLDLLFTGYVNSSDQIARIAINYGGVFIESDQGFFDMYQGTAVWGDYDNDGDLDALLTGSNTTKLYKNEGLTANSTPTVPSGLQYQVSDNILTLSWNRSSDNETDHYGLSYNVRIGSSSGAIDDVSPHSNLATGMRLIPERGNAGSSPSYVTSLDNIAIGDHFWSVQAVDNNFAASSFSEENSILAIPPTASFEYANDTICFIDTAIITYTGNASEFASYTWDFDGAEYVSGSGKGPYEVHWNNYGTYNVSLKVTEEGLSSEMNMNAIRVSAQCFQEVEALIDGCKSSSVSWGDYDNDMDMDFAISGETGYHTYISKIYRNDGDNSFVDINAPLEGVSRGDFAWCDYDNDGDLDLFLTGTNYSAGFTGVSKIYRNDGTDTFSDIALPLPVITSGSVDWGDYDNDGDYDFFLMGYDQSAIYRNDGNDSFTDIQANIAQASIGDCKWGDYDNDGDLDLILCGSDGSDKLTKIYRNDGNDVFTDINAALVNVSSGSVDWGDYDADGDLDILLCGYIEPRYTSKIYRNEGNDEFVDINAGLKGIMYASNSWGDIDNDGDLDVVLSGKTEDQVHVRLCYKNEGNDVFTKYNIPLSAHDLGVTVNDYVISDHDLALGDYDFDNDLDILITWNDFDEQLHTSIYRNECQILNTSPDAPSDLTSAIQNDTVVLSWSASTDEQTDETGLSYNVRIGSASGNIDKLSPMSDLSSGSHYIPAKGNSGVNTFLKLGVNSFNPGTNFWSVQAIDNSFIASSFAAEETVDNIPPTSNFYAEDSICYSDTLTITYAGNASPTASYDWTFENADYIEGTGQGPFKVKWQNPGNYSVSLVVTENAVISESTTKTISIGDRCLKETSIAIQGTYEGESAWGDYDGDGDLDILVSSYYLDDGAHYASRIYRNDGNDVFTDINADLPEASTSLIDWGDYDNDNDLDFVMIQSYDGSPSIFKNNGDDTFTDINAELYYASSGSVKWGDYNNDGDLDIIIVGSTKMKIYENEGNDVFSEKDLVPAYFYGLTVNWCDFDNDNDLDIFAPGQASYGVLPVEYGFFYRNDGENGFTELHSNLTSIHGLSSDVGDYDSDGDQDIILTGADEYGTYITKIYRNDGAFVFTDIEAELIAGKDSYVSWGDMDNDGDLDFIFTGDTLSYDPATIIYENLGNDSFQRLQDELFGTYKGIVCWGDYDKDNDLDLMISGNHITKIYKNYLWDANEVPTPPTNLVHEIMGDTLILKWSPGSDNETGQHGISYNVRIGSSSSGFDNVSPVSDNTTGAHFLPESGNAGTDTSFMVSLEALSIGSNYWSVQSIDNSFIASEFATEQIITDIPPTSSFEFDDVCFVDTASIIYGGIASPTAAYDWSFEEADYIEGSGQGPYFVHWDTPGSYTISLQVTEDSYTSNITSKQIDVQAQCFKTDTVSIDGIYEGSIDLGDYDDDGDLDVLVVGRTASDYRNTWVYRNNGNFEFEELSPGVKDISYGDASWGDFDNDNDLDIVLAGSALDGIITTVYRNDGAGTFSEIGIDASGINRSTVCWMDYDNDGDLDFSVAGYRTNLYIYRNNGDETFEEVEEIYYYLLPAYPQIKWADFDNDKDLDLLLHDSYFINNGDHTFSPIDTFVNLSWLDKFDFNNDGGSELIQTSFSSNSRAIGDLDNDGDLDVLLSRSDTTILLKNMCYHPNTDPSPPTNLNYILQSDSLIMTWDKAFDTESGQDSLTYNIRIGSTPGAVDNMSPMANTGTNYRLVPRIGNASHDTSYYINFTSLTIGTNYWSIQTIDQGLAVSDFATESMMIDIPPSALFSFDDSLCYYDTISILYSGNASPAASYNWDFGDALFTSGSGQGPYMVHWGTPGYHAIGLEVTESGVTNMRTDSIYLTNHCFKATKAAFQGVYEGVSAWADYDSDGDLDVLISGSTLYRNEGNDIFTSLNPGIITVNYGTIDWGDYDNDGDPDILIAGYSSIGGIRKIYRNEGSDVFIDINYGFVQGPIGSSQFGNNAYWGDYDNDGDLDVLTSGLNSSGNPVGKIYRNDNNDAFTDIEADIPQVSLGDMKWIDIDNDDLLDIVAAGTDMNGNRLAYVCMNTDNDVFVRLNSGFTELTKARIAIADFNNDGYPDIIFSGNAFEGDGTWLYQNNGDLSFTNIDAGLNLNYVYGHEGYDLKWMNINNDDKLDLIASSYSLSYKNYISRSNNPGVYKNEGNAEFQIQNDALLYVDRSSSSFADYDNDGDLDLLVSGRLGVDTTILYENHVYTPNDPPSAPMNLESSIFSKNVILSWDRANDTETPSKGLSYNIILGSTPGNVDVVSPGSDISGYRTIVRQGNAGYDTTFSLNNLAEGTYYWQVQSIDNVHSGSEFSRLNAFTINETFTEINLNIASGFYGGLAWGDYDNDGDLDIAYSEIDFMFGFLPSLKILRNDGDGQFTDIFQSLVTDFIMDTDALFYWYDLNNDGLLDLLDLKNKRILRNDGNDVFAMIEYDLENISSYAVGDYDNDTDLDILISEKGVDTTIYILRNDGNFVFSPVDIGLAGLADGSVSFADIDNDLDLDILITGEIVDNTPLSLLYRNDGNNTFSTLDAELEGVIESTVKWCDYDNDSDLDFILTGLARDDQKFTAVYRNNGDNTFSNIHADIRSVIKSSIDWGDYDYDGDNDLMITGESGTIITLLYSNDGNDVFTELDYPFNSSGVDNVAWGNYDNDGDLDILLQGTGIYLYRNNINWSDNLPAAPANLHSELTGFGIVLHWDKATDDITPSNGLSYNVRLGTEPASADIINPMSDIASGYRKNTASGNALSNNAFRIDTLSEGKYYWSVQAIDNSKQGGTWAEIDSFEISVIRPYFDYTQECEGYSTLFTDQTLAAGDPLTDWLWDFGDGQSSIIQNPSHLYNTAGIYTVTLTASAGDQSKSLTKSVYVKSNPQANFSATTECLLDHATVFTNTSMIDTLEIDEWYWNFGNGTSSYEENPADILYLLADTFNVKLRITAKSGCIDSITKPVYIGEYPNATVFLDGGAQFCSGDSTNLLVQYNNNYLFKWKLDDIAISNGDSSILKVKSAGIYSAEVVNKTGNCLSISDAVSISVDQSPASPFINAIGNTTFCQGDSVVLSVTNNPDLSYRWLLNEGSTGINSHTLTATTSGTYSLEVSNTSGCSALSSNTVVVIVQTLPNMLSIKENGATDFCNGDSVNLSVTADPLLTYQWMDDKVTIEGATTNLYTARTSGNYKLVISNTNNCYIHTQSVEVNVSPTPDTPSISYIGDTTFCAGGSLDLSVTDDPDLTFQWLKDGGNIGDNQNSYSAITSGMYNLRITNTSECTATSSNTVAITVNAVPGIPAITVTGDKIFCEGKSTTLSVEDNASLTYQWMNGSTNIADADSFSYSATSSGSYKLKVSNEDACSNESTPVDITVNPSPASPSISYMGDTIFCAGGSLDLSVTDDPDLDFQWLKDGGNIGENQNSYTVNTSGKYNLRITNTSECTATSSNTVTVTVNEKPTVPNVVIGGETTFCAGKSVKLSVTDNSELTYQWLNDIVTIADSTSNTFTAKNSGSYFLNITNLSGCISKTVPVDVTVKPSPSIPKISVDGPVKFCEGGMLTLSVTDDPDLSYQWLRDGGKVGNNLNEYSATTSSLYTVQITNAYDCIAMSSDTISVTVYEKPERPEVNVEGDKVFCNGDSVSFDVPEIPTLSYQWIDGVTKLVSDTSNVFTATSSGNYKIRITNADGCSNESTVQEVRVNASPDAPTITYTGDLDFCAGESVVLKVNAIPGANYDWLKAGITTGQTGSSLSVSSEGLYSLKVTNTTTNCDVLSTNAVDVIVHDMPSLPAIQEDGDLTFCEGEKLILNVLNPEAFDYQWMNEDGSLPGENGTNIEIKASGNYYLTVSNPQADHCIVSTIPKTVLVHAYPSRPVISSENYEYNGCQDFNPVILYVDNPEDGIKYYWIKNNAKISGAEELTYEGYLTEDEYKVRADNHGCYLESDSIIILYAEMPDKPSIIAEGPTVWYLACSDTSATDYQWYLDGQIIAGANERIYVANQEFGKYEVSISEGACYTKSDPVWIPLGTGIETDPWENLKIYPNPTPGLFTLEMDNPIMGELIINIMNERGSQVLNIKFLKEMSHFQTQIDLSGQPAALYLIGLMLDDWRTTRSLVVE